MGCKFNDFEGKCEVFNESIEDGLGCEADGVCVCEDDDDPSDSCSNYESDDTFDDVEDEDDIDEDDIDEDELAEELDEE